MDDVAVGLLARLAAAIPAASLRFAAEPTPLAAGFDTKVFAFTLADAPSGWSGPLVLRLFRKDAPPERVRFEAAIHDAVRRQGYPAPRILHVEPERGALEGAFLVMERAPGAPLLGSDPLHPRTLRMPALLAEAQLRLHALATDSVEAALTAAGIPLSWVRVESEIDWHARRIAEVGLDALAPAIAWLRGHRPPPGTPALCHGDFHPFNVIADAGRVTGVIDWTFPHVKIDDPACDVGATLALLSHGPVDVPPWLRRPVLWARGRLVAAYRRAYLRRRPLPERSLDYFYALRLVGFLVEGCEHRLAVLGLRPMPDKPTAFGAPETVREAARAFEARTGVALALPPEPDARAAHASRGAKEQA